MDLLPENFFTYQDFYLEHQLYEHARRFLRRTQLDKQDGSVIFFTNLIESRLGLNDELLRNLADILDHRIYGFAAAILLTNMISKAEKKESGERGKCNEANEILSMSKFLVKDKVLHQVRQKIGSLQNVSDTDVLFIASWAHFQCEELHEASRLMDKLLGHKEQTSIIFALASKLEVKQNGWSEKSKQLIDSAIRAGTADVASARLLLASYYLDHGDLESAQNALNDWKTQSEKLVPGQVKQLEILAAMSNWDAVESAAERFASGDPNMILFSIYSCVAKISTRRSASWKDLDGLMISTLERVEKLELKNAEIIGRYCGLLSQLALGRPTVQQKAASILEKTAKMVSATSAAATKAFSECGRLFLAQRKYLDAFTHFEKAMSFAEQNQSASKTMTTRKILSLIQLRKLDQAKKELENESAIKQDLPQPQVGNFPSTSVQTEFLRLFISTAEKEEPTQLLKRCADVLEDLRAESDILAKRRPSLQNMTLEDLYFVYCMLSFAMDFTFPDPTKIPLDSRILDSIESVLTKLVSLHPGTVDLSVLLAKVFYRKNDTAKAAAVLDHFLQNETFGSDGGILLGLAEVALAENANDQAKTYLDRAIANDFNLESNLDYVLLRSRLNRLNKEPRLAIDFLRKHVNQLNRETVIDNENPPRGSELLTELIQCYMDVKDYREAETIVQDAYSKFRDTILEPRIILADAQMLMTKEPESKNIEALLKRVDENWLDYYILARNLLGRYYLRTRRQKEYTELHEELYTKMGATSAAARLLGEAYLKLPNAKKAIEVMQKATRERPNDAELEAAMGQFFIRCHLYNNALNYYEAAIKRGNTELRLTLADLLIKLGRVDRAETLLVEISTVVNDNFKDCYTASKALAVLANMYGVLDRQSDRLSTLQKAKSSFERDMLKARREKPDLTTTIQKSLTDVTVQISDIMYSKREFQAAAELLEQCRLLATDDLLATVLDKLARATFMQGDMGNTYRLLRELEKANPSHKSTKLLLAQVAFRRKDFDHALDTYRDYFRTQTADWLAMAEAIPVLVRIGQIRILERMMSELTDPVTTEQKIAKSYSYGLLNRYMGNTEKALELIKNGLESRELCNVAIRALVEIVCNWDTELVGSQYFPSTLNGRAELIPLCIRILKMMSTRNTAKDSNSFVEKLPVLCSGEHQKLEDMRKILELRVHESMTPENVLLIACIHLVLGAKDQAEEKLKLFDKHPWNIEDADFLERIWLLRAELIGLADRSDEVNQLIFRATEFNRFSYLCSMYEGIHYASYNLSKSAESFRKAFEATGCRDFVSGERCALSLIKCNRPTEAVNVLDAFRPVGDVTAKSRTVVSAEAWNVLLELRRKALNALALRSEDEKDDTRTRGRRASKALGPQPIG